MNKQIYYYTQFVAFHNISRRETKFVIILINRESGNFFTNNYREIISKLNFESKNKKR